MKSVIIVRYCEIHLKGKNKKFFEKLLINAIQKSLSDIPHKLAVMNARYLIEDFNENDYDTICERLSKIFGVHSYSPAKVVKSDFDEIAKCCLELVEGKTGTFKVNTNRADKKFPLPSPQMSRELGGVLLEKYHEKIKVDVINPSFSVNVDIRESGETLIYTDVIKGFGVIFNWRHKGYLRGILVDDPGRGADVIGMRMRNNEVFQ